MHLTKTLKDNFLIQFTVVSFVVLAVVAAALTLSLSNTVRVNAIRAATDETVAENRARILAHITAADLVTPMTGERYTQFDKFVQESIVSDRTAQVKLWGADNTVIYSTDQALVGVRFADNENVAKALHGETTAEIPSSAKLAKEGEPPEALIEVYTPIVFSGNSEPQGVIEIYTYYGPTAHLISELRRQLFATIGIGFVVLYGALVSGVWRGWRTLMRQRKEREQAEELFRTMSDSSPVGIFIVADGKFQFVNPQFEKCTGYSRDQLLGTDLLAIVLPEDRDLVRENAVKMLREQRSAPYEYRLVNALGETKWAMETLVPIDYQGKQATLGNCIDITERKLAEKALREADERLRQSQKMEAVGRLAGGVAHDFNNLLTVIMVCSEMLLNKIREANPMHQDVVEIKKAADRASTLTKQLLVLSRRQVLQPEALGINSVTSDLQKMLGRIVGEDYHLDTILDPKLDSVKADRGSIDQVIMNLVVNARDAMPQGGRIIIRTENVILGDEDSRGILEARPGKFVRISVTDTGTGMSQDVLQHIFEPFFTTKGKGKGTGLGLSMVYGIVKQTGGWTNVYSELGKGSTFRIYLPVVLATEEDANKPDENTLSSVDLRGNGERILLVEDEEAIRAVAERVLTQHGYIVFPTSSAEEALGTYKRESGNFQLVLSDVVLPGKSGVELATQLNTINPQLRIMLTSGYADEKSQFEVIQDHSYPFLSKPYTSEALLLSVKKELTSSINQRRTE